jgi:hypothetical protein
MAFEDVDKTTLIIKARLFDWIIMPFGVKNVIDLPPPCICFLTTL